MDQAAATNDLVITAQNYKDYQGLLMSRTLEIQQGEGLKFKAAREVAAQEMAQLVRLSVPEFESTMSKFRRQCVNESTRRDLARHPKNGNGQGQFDLLKGSRLEVTQSPLVKAELIDRPAEPALATIVTQELKRHKPKVGQQVAMIWVNQQVAKKAQKSVSRVVKTLKWKGFRSQVEGARLTITRL